jgi:flagellar hook-basal body complex protein FliE
MTPSSIQPLLSQMQTMATQATGSAPQNLKESQSVQGSTEFGSMLMSSLEKINSMGQSAKAQAREFQTGAPGIEIHQVMIDNQKAGLAFEMGVQVRNKAISAYKEIMNMQV